MIIASSPEKTIMRGEGEIEFSCSPPDNLCLQDIMLPDEDPLFLSAQMFDDTGVELLQSADIVYTFEGPDLTVDHIEVVQVTQTVNHTVPLVQNKRTLVRVYPGLADDSPDADAALRVTVALEGFDGASPLAGSPLSPISPWRRAKPVKRAGAKPTMAERRRTLSSVNFLLPPGWTQQAITLRAIVDPAGTVVGDKEENNSRDLPANFQRTNNLSVGYLRFSVPPAAGAAPVAPSMSVSDAGQWVQRVYPVRDGGLAYLELTAAPVPWPTPIIPPGGTLADGRARLHLTLTRIYNLVESSLFIDQIVGYLHSSIVIYAGGNQGDSDPLWSGKPGRSTLVIEQGSQNNRGYLLGHELGHNLGLRHATTVGKPCKGGGNSSWAGKFPDNGIQDIGWDLFGGVGPMIKPPAMTTGDMMGYCWTAWISPYHYEKLFDGGFAPGALTEGRKVKPTRRLQSVPADYFLVSGSIDADGLSGELDPIYRINSATTGDQPVGGSTCIQLQNGGYSSGALF